MKKFVAIAVVAMLSISISQAKGNREVKFLYWNIQNGMWADQGNNYDNFVEFVNSIAPDVCIWCEAESRYRTDTCIKMESCEEAYLPYNWDLLAARYGHKYVVLAGKRDTFPQVITSRYPLRTIKRINGDGKDIIVVHGAGLVELNLDNEKVNIVTLHTWPQKYAYKCDDMEKSKAEQGGDSFRRVEMEYICKETIMEADNPEKQNWIMLGDFNAISSTDNYHYGKNPSDKAFLVHDFIRDSTPYIDIVAEKYPGDFQHTTLSGRRIDFVYMTYPLFKRLKDVQVIRKGYPQNFRLEDMHSFCKPSDHYPIVFTLKK